MIPKHANPYLLTDQTAVVSRSALRDSDDELEPEDAADPERAQMLARLENILKRSIADVLPKTAQEGDVTGESSSRKKKRRKVDASKVDRHEDEDDSAGPVAVPFRLLSGASQPKPIVLAPKAPRKIIAIGPAAEDTKEEAERRAARAREVAVDFAWVIDESEKSYPSLPNASKKIRHIQASLPTPEPPILVLERPTSPSKPPHLSLRDPAFPVEPSPHLPEVACCPILDASGESTPAGAHKKHKRRRSNKVRPKPPVQATFWRPTQGMGGKSLGYAWGFGGSWPLPEGEPPRYHRDSMRKAVLA